MRIRCCADCADTIDLFRITDAGGGQPAELTVVPFLEQMRDCDCPALNDLRKWVRDPDPAGLWPQVVAWKEGGRNRRQQQDHSRPAPPPKIKLTLFSPAEPKAMPNGHSYPRSLSF